VEKTDYAFIIYLLARSSFIIARFVARINRVTSSPPIVKFSLRVRSVDRIVDASQTRARPRSMRGRSADRASWMQSPLSRLHLITRYPPPLSSVPPLSRPRVPIHRRRSLTAALDERDSLTLFRFS